MRRYQKLISIIACVALMLGLIPLGGITTLASTGKTELYLDTPTEGSLVTVVSGADLQYYSFTAPDDETYVTTIDISNDESSSASLNVSHYDESGRLLARELNQRSVSFLGTMIKGETHSFRVSSYYAVDFTILVKTAAVSTLLTLDKSEIVELEGQTLWLYGSFDGKPEKITWTSDNPEVLDFCTKNDDSAQFTLLKAGSATITATSENGLTATCKVTVTAKPDATSIVVSPGDLYLYVGETRKVEAIFAPENCWTETVAWHVADNTVAAFDSSYILGKQEGTTTVTATSERGLSDEITVTVMEPASLSLNEPQTIDGIHAYRFNFVPEKSGKYYFSSFENDFDTYGTLYDQNMNQLSSNDDSGEGNNFQIEYFLNAGETYTLETRPYSGTYSGTYTIIVEDDISAARLLWEYSIENDEIVLYKYLGSETNVVIPATMVVGGIEYPVTTLGEDYGDPLGKSTMFESVQLTSITIPSSIRKIGSSAFFRCNTLQAVYITDLSAWCGISCENRFGTAYNRPSYSPLYYAEHLYLNGELVEELVIPEDVSTIKNYAFCNASIKTAIIPEGVHIDPWAFAYCDELISVTIPDSVTSIDKYTFYGCSSLTSVTIPNSVTAINSYAFGCCNSLTSVTIPESVTSIGYFAFGDCTELKTAIIYNPDIVLDESAFPTTTEVIYKKGVDKTKPHLEIDSDNTNLAILNTIDLKVSRVYWGYAGTEEIEAANWNTFTAAVPSSIRVSDYNPTEGEVYAMEKQGYYLFWIQYTDAEGKTQNISQTVYAEGTLDENYGKPYLELDETGKVAWMNLNGTTVQKMYWGFIGDTDYKYSTWNEFKTRIGDTYLPDYGVKDSEGYIVNKEGYYRFVIVYLDEQGIRQERYFTIKAETPATAPSMDNSTLSNVATFVNNEGYTSKTYYGYIGTENTKYVDFNTFKATAIDFTTDFGTPAGKSFKLDKAGYWRFVINYNVNGATKDTVCTVYVDEADLSLGTPKLTQSGKKVTLNANGSTVSKVYIGYMGTEEVEVDNWVDYTANCQTNTVYYGPKDGTAFTLGTTTGYYTVVVSYNNGGADQLALYMFEI